MGEQKRRDPWKPTRGEVRAGYIESWLRSLPWWDRSHERKMRIIRVGGADFDRWYEATLAEERARIALSGQVDVTPALRDLADDMVERVARRIVEATPDPMVIARHLARIELDAAYAEKRDDR